MWLVASDSQVLTLHKGTPNTYGGVCLFCNSEGMMPCTVAMSFRVNASHLASAMTCTFMPSAFRS